MVNPQIGDVTILDTLLNIPRISLIVLIDFFDVQVLVWWEPYVISVKRSYATPENA